MLTIYEILFICNRSSGTLKVLVIKNPAEQTESANVAMLPNDVQFLELFTRLFLF